VEALAIHIRSKPEAHRRYSCKQTEKMIPGIIIAADSVQKVTNENLSCYVTADYDFGAGEIKLKSLLLCNVKVGRGQAPCHNHLSTIR
jgi:hypothetical protein